MTQTEPPDSADSAEELVRLIAQAQRRLYAFIFALVRRPADVDDILQETNVVLWRKRETFELGTDFFAWAYAVARLQVLAHRSRQHRGVFLLDEKLFEELAEAARTELESFDRREMALGHCLERLPAGQRQLITRRYRPGTSVQALAVELGKSARAVSESLRRIRSELRKCIERTLAMESHS